MQYNLISDNVYLPFSTSLHYNLPVQRFAFRLHNLGFLLVAVLLSLSQNTIRNTANFTLGFLCLLALDHVTLQYFLDKHRLDLLVVDSNIGRDAT